MKHLLFGSGRLFLTLRYCLFHHLTLVLQLFIVFLKVKSWICFSQIPAEEWILLHIRRKKVTERLLMHVDILKLNNHEEGDDLAAVIMRECRDNVISESDSLDISFPSLSSNCGKMLSSVEKRAWNYSWKAWIRSRLSATYFFMRTVRCVGFVMSALRSLCVFWCRNQVFSRKIIIILYIFKKLFCINYQFENKIAWYSMENIYIYLYFYQQKKTSHLYLILITKTRK